MRVLFFGNLRDITGHTEIEMTVGRLDTDGLWEKLVTAYPGLQRFRSSVRLAKNLEYVGADAQFNDADEVALIPPVSGG